MFVANALILLVRGLVWKGDADPSHAGCTQGSNQIAVASSPNPIAMRNDSPARAIDIGTIV